MAKEEKPGPCCLCGEKIPVEHGTWIWGHNPDPLGSPEESCCGDCNDSLVTPSRIAQMMGGDWKKFIPKHRRNEA